MFPKCSNEWENNRTMVASWDGSVISWLDLSIVDAIVCIGRGVLNGVVVRWKFNESCDRQEMKKANSVFGRKAELNRNLNVLKWGWVESERSDKNILWHIKSSNNCYLCVRITRNIIRTFCIDGTSFWILTIATISNKPTKQSWSRVCTWFLFCVQKKNCTVQLPNTVLNIRPRILHLRRCFYSTNEIFSDPLTYTSICITSVYKKMLSLYYSMHKYTWKYFYNVAYMLRMLYWIHCRNYRVKFVRYGNACIDFIQRKPKCRQKKCVEWKRREEMVYSARRAGTRAQKDHSYSQHITYQISYFIKLNKFFLRREHLFHWKDVEHLTVIHGYPFHPSLACTRGVRAAAIGQNFVLVDQSTESERVREMTDSGPTYPRVKTFNWNLIYHLLLSFLPSRISGVMPAAAAVACLSGAM